ncbi:MAG: hypothetical protein LBR11_08565 [Deltaproteobacteria bacterium]|nr:hypothetical protein [Deltaproteobacteria bacterium]
MLDAIEAAWRGQRELFKGLWLSQPDLDWWPYPVIKLNLIFLIIYKFK